MVIGELWAQWWAAQWRWEAELERVAGREAAAQWAAGREVALARWQREEEKRRRFQEADEERKKAEEERWLKAVRVCAVMEGLGLCPTPPHRMGQGPMS